MIMSPTVYSTIETLPVKSLLLESAMAATFHTVFVSSRFEINSINPQESNILQERLIRQTAGLHSASLISAVDHYTNYLCVFTVDQASCLTTDLKHRPPMLPEDVTIYSIQARVRAPSGGGEWREMHQSLSTRKMCLCIPADDHEEAEEWSGVCSAHGLICFHRGMKSLWGATGCLYLT